ncbi:MAG TPA: hypothetical protein VFZ18_08030 [Longimicrobiaceae bacterium]|nr:hypothetical protein [Longimicrobium sp.]
MKGSRGGIVVGMVCGVLLAAAIALASSAPVPVGPNPVLTAVELDSLSVYLGPSAPAPLLDEYGAFLPAVEAEPLSSAGPLPAHAAAPPPAAYAVTAIVTGGSRPLAIIDDATFAPGAMLPDGARVVSIEKDHVVLRHPDGTLRTLRLKAG